ncbi:DUF4334 domain-containing protein [Haliea sp. E17]|uniref:DUF4334 domain-containing protein n=1 Tax=Haliea sp. E17 TaxID=3401576 RepID=UPI003AAED050
MAPLLEVLLEKPAPYDEEALFACFDSLAAVEPGQLQGDWSGGLLATGHPGEGRLAALNWVGKKFVDPNQVYPIIVSTDGGGREISEVMGQASLREVKYRGGVTTAMIYDVHPVIDYFRAFDDDTVLGVMDYKGVPAPLFFYLRRL